MDPFEKTLYILVVLFFLIIGGFETKSYLVTRHKEMVAELAKLPKSTITIGDETFEDVRKSEKFKGFCGCKEDDYMRIYFSNGDYKDIKTFNKTVIEKTYGVN